MFRFLRPILLALVFGLCSSAAWALPPVWVAHGANGATVVLFGSVHILPPGLTWEPPRLKQALASADDLWFEIPIDPASNLAAGQAALAAGMQPPGQTLSAQLTPAQQIGYLAAAPMHDQIASLRETLDDIDAGSVSYRRLVTAWMAGDTRTIRREALTPMIRDAPGIYRTLVVARNQRWIDPIVQRLQGKGEAVMVVGVGHLVGPDSVPSLLRARGIRVDGP